MNLSRFHYSSWVGTFLLLLVTFSASAEEVKILNLEDSLQIAQQNNLTVQSADQNLKSAEAQISVARAAMLPRLAASGNYTYFKNVQKSVIQAEGGFGFPIPGDDTNEMSTPNMDNEADLIELEFGAHHNVQGTVNLTQPVFAWGRYYYGYQAAKLKYEAAEKTLNAAYEKLRLDVYEAFYRVLIAQEFVKVAEQSVTLVKKQLGIAETSFDAGATTNFDVLRAKVLLANAESQLIRAKNGVKTAKNAFKTLLNLPFSEDVSVKGSFEIPKIEIQLDELIKLALEKRPEITQSQLNEQAGQKQLSVAKTLNLPDFAFFSNYQISHNERLTQMNRIWSLGLQINIPIFDGFASRAGVQQSESVLAQLQLGTKQVISAVEFEVRNAYLALLEAKTLIDVQRETVAQAQESVRIATIQFENGMITTVGLTDTQLALMQAKVNRLQAQHDYVVGLARLEKAIGQKIQ
ncbi:MAG: TolC family protein [Candidatus Poribacteria bacterium]|nr:TolC family protein [Candidatus Poribacteria bacterium]